MSRSYRKHLYSKYFDHPRTSWKECKKLVHRFNRNRCKQALRNGLDPLPDIPFTWFDYDFIKIYQGKGRHHYRYHGAFPIELRRK